jgi:cobalamin biosynthesis protein CobD/CbiB
MKNKTQKFFSGLLTILAIVLILFGLSTEAYLISLFGLFLILLMLVIRSLYIRKLNRQIREITKDMDKNFETEHTQDK